ncbi:uncharacterized protein PV07_10374 [Cladophialophora immunda]|uniref:C6 transcription factor RegA n=1 Tax=Cladophialophora immunda TaxID=569365 RepID=A0A0D2AIE7_9EURO|nr:uncharacterized protein PV07_10374 [Cladophialophora immunda]KIW24672.1 hypothetical protein PV07_10374 [Cladophialophora immunda]OQV00732.1 Fungal specific transcription factor domain-containing protein [Cladophialophora immunda]
MMTPPPPGTSAYQCAICKEQYSRPDHLIRHVRTHTKQRPFVCVVCTKAFARQDLLKRHAQGHHNQGHTSKTFQQNADRLADLGRYGPRVRQACRACAMKKLKCTDSKPCRRCTERGISCDYDQSPEPSQHDVPMDSEEAPMDHDSLLLARPGQTPEASWPEVSRHHDTPVQEDDFAQPLAAADTANLHAVPSEFRAHMTHTETLSSAADGPFQTVIGCTFDLPSFGDFIQDDADPVMGDLDFPFFPDLVTTPAGLSIGYKSSDSMTVESPVMGMGTEAYRGSHVRKGWNPQPGDNSLETESLELPSTARLEVSSTLLNSKQMLRKEDLTVSTRDRLLAMIYARTSRSIWERLSSTFESVDVIKGIINHALLHLQEHQMIPFIHIASFDLNQQRPELLGALMAYGAVCLPSANLRKFGYGLQELVRLAVNHRLEDEHASVRDLGMAQAYYIQLYLGFWSGISAKIEAAESSSMLGATILRRGKMCQAGNYQPPEAFLALEGLSLQQKWFKWAEQESRKRLVYFAMLLDAGVSLARKISPLFAYSDITTPLPTVSRLWEAATADEWHRILTDDNNLRLQQPQPVKWLLREPQLLSADQTIVDTTAAGAAILAGYWALVYEYRQMEALHRNVQGWNDFVLKSRHTELVSLLDRLRMEMSDIDSRRPQIVLLQELILLHLNAAYYEISAYSGRSTMEDAQAAEPYVQWWSDSQQARHAIWHAGQIFRFARSLRPGTLTDMSVIALYHATETMWVWGLLRRIRHPDLDPSSVSPVVLDEDESPAVTKFVRMSRGQPGVTGLSSSFVPLVEPASVSDLANDILKANWGAQTQPWTTSEVSRLVQGFSKISRHGLAG